ncbi:acyltransferase family protein [Pusillimonas sp. ANT_WB101]|uniref:acyltransferase family protein n=1 Tax=Pusillimonas sp. ANT_WB101 TaxID=2597356 RepID=UPI0011EDA8C6|nr:acyltransferase family protein [Pusillimonas sp. ANT_WB101]KAA0889508.1 acyltransferase [Pusillimonas sp. ANT_WB101]
MFIKVNEYRSDIDGLRAFAVVTVFLFHINFSLVPAGYVGVDVFFVISGYLITRILIRDFENRTFSLRSFYARRIMRILPPFFVVMLISVTVGCVLLLPEDSREMTASAKYATLFISNIFFSRAKGYFDASSDEFPLLHTWSLSVEEQFYLLWPLAVGLFFLIVRRTAISRYITRRRLLAGLIASLIVICFVWTQYALSHADNYQRLYFLLQARAGELLMGGLVCSLDKPRSTRWTGAASIAGMVLVIAPMFLLSKDSLYPGYNAVLPCVGTGLILYMGQCDNYSNTWANKLLSLKGLVGIGLISYSLYLWHWPILAYMRYVYGRYELPISWLLLAVITAFFLAGLNYIFVEQKTRRRHVSFIHAVSVFYFLPGAVTLPLVGYIVPHMLFPAKAEPNNAEIILRSYGVDVCHGTFDKHCVRGDATKQVRVLVTGDSHAASLNAFMDVVGRKEGWASRVLTGSSCSPVFGLDVNVLPSSSREPCERLKVYLQSNYINYDVIVFTSFWAYQLGWTEDKADPRYLEKFSNTLRTIAQKVPVYVLSDVPRLTISPFRLAHFESLGLDVKRHTSDEAAKANLLVKSVVTDIPGVKWVDLTAAFDEFDQRSLYKGVPVYFDDNHLNVYGSTQLGNIFATSQRLLP